MPSSNKARKAITQLVETSGARDAKGNETIVDLGSGWGNLIIRMAMKYPDRPPTMGMPYGGIEDLRPETQELLRIFAMGMPKKK